MNEAKGVSAADGQHLSDDARGTEIGRLATEVFGHEAETFMSTPRASLGMRSPADAIADGDIDQVREVLIRSLLGDWP
jgi:uncharacterized protein (DUF2384 family)